MNKDFCFNKIVNDLDPVDFETYKNGKEDFYAVVTNMTTGKAEYIKIDDLKKEDQIEYLRASGSMPFLSKPVIVHGKSYLDGGISDSIPIVVLTRPENYRKKKSNTLFPKIYYRKYPYLTEAINNRYRIYNQQLDMVKDLESAGKIFVLKPSRFVDIKRIERDLEKIQEMYDLGQEDATKKMDALDVYLKG